MKKKMQLLINNKKVLIIIAVVILLVIISIALIMVNSSKGNKIICTKNYEFVTGIDLDEKTIITLNKDKIAHIAIEKRINFDGYYQQFDTYRDAIFNHMNEAYQYLDKKDYKIEKNNDNITAKIEVKREGVILNNLEITKLNETSRDDLRINSSNNLESSSSTYKINDEYRKEELKKKLEGLGYKCES